MSLLNTGRSELSQANQASKTSTDMANKRQAQKSSLEYQNDVANNNRNGALAGSAVNLGIAYAGYKHDQAVQESKGLSGQSGGMNNSATGNSIANNDAFRSGTGDKSISGAGGNGGVVGSDAGGKSFNDAGSQGTPASQGLARSNATGSIEVVPLMIMQRVVGVVGITLLIQVVMSDLALVQQLLQKPLNH